MKRIYSSATKITLILFSVSLCAGLFLGKISEDTFKTCALMVLAFYFGKGGGTPTEDTPPTV